MCTSLAKCVLFVVNFVIAIVAATVTVLGALIAYSKPVLSGFIDESMTYLNKHMSEAQSEIYNKSISTLVSLGRTPGLVIMISGIVVLLIVTIGFIGICTENRLLIVSYASILILLCLIHAGGIIYYYVKKDDVKKTIERGVIEALVKYKSIQTSDLDSIVAAIVMSSLSCCGCKDGSTYAKPKNKLFLTEDKIDGVLYENLIYPLPCCKGAPSKEPGACPGTLTNETSNHAMGCLEKFRTVVLSKLDMLILSSLAVIGVMVVMIIFSLLVK